MGTGRRSATLLVAGVTALSLPAPGLAQITPAPCTEQPRLFVAREGGPALSWDASGCELTIERSTDPTFPSGEVDVLHDPLDGSAPTALLDANPPDGLVFYRLAAWDGGWPYWEACRRSPGLDVARTVTLQYDNGAIDTIGVGLGEDDIEAVQFIPEAPMILDRIWARFWGTPGPITVRVLADFGRAWPDENRDLIPPIELDTVSTDDWVAIDISSHGLLVHPNERFWVAYVHQQEEPWLVLDNGHPVSHSKLKDPETTPPPFVWSSWFNGNEYLLRVEGRTFCEVDRPLFADRSTESTLAGYNAAWVAWGDANGDGWDDLLLNGPTLLWNDTNGGFLDFTAASGLLAYRDAGPFGLWGDVDNDGDQDLFLGVWTGQPAAPGDPTDHLLLNDGFGRFQSAPVSDVQAQDTSATATFGDFDADGFLDLFVGNWLAIWPNPPSMLDRLYRGAGDGTFVDVTDTVGMGDQGPDNRPCYAVSGADYDDDGDLDLFAGNYGHEPNFLWQNQHAQGSETFVDVAAATGLAEDGTPPGGLTYGADWGDVDNDGDLDVIVPEIAHPRVLDFADPSSLQINSGGPDPVFVNETVARGIVYDEGGLEASFVDFDNDGDLDIFLSHVYPLHPATLYRQEADGSFQNVTYEAGIDVMDCLGHAWADHDRDGDLDLVLANEGPGSHVWLFENLEGATRSWLTVRLEGEGCSTPGGCNCSGIGARVSVTSEGVTRMREVQGGKGHNVAQGSLAVEFGLGDASSIDELRVRWPCGREETYTGAEVSRFVLLREGVPEAVLE